MPSPADWPPELDALMAAPEYHKVILESEQVRVLDTRIEPGQTAPVHTHCWSATHYVISWSDFVRRDASGGVQLDTGIAGLSVNPGQALWSNPLGPHTLEVVGKEALHIVSIEIKQRP